MNRTAVVTGASKGIGAAISQRLLESGITVKGIARDFSGSTLTHTRFTPYVADLSILTELQKCLAKLSADCEPDILICNAGSGKFGSIEQYSTEQIERELQLNLNSHIHATRELVTSLKKKQRSDIIFIGSESALQGGRFGSIYSAAKFGLRGFAQALRHECATSNCHVSIINPGMVRSEFFNSLPFEPGESPDNALQCDDIANAVNYILQSPDHAVIDEININPLKKVVKKTHPRESKDEV